jgi:hypothetical protein
MVASRRKTPYVSSTVRARSLLSNEHRARARSNKTSTPSSLLADSTNSERAIARADGAVCMENNDRELEAMEVSTRSVWFVLFIWLIWFNSLVSFNQKTKQTK